MLRIRQLEVFHAVMTARSISAASRALQISQPVVSRTIRRLEDNFSVVLFERRHGRLIPTREALRIDGEIDQIMARIRSLDRRLANLVAGDDELFRIGASPSVSRHLAPVALGKVVRKAPGLSVFLDTLLSDETVDYLIAGPGECVVTTMAIDHPAIASRRLGSGALVAALPRQHPLAARRVLAAVDFAGVDVIGYIDENGPHSQATRVFLGKIEPRVRLYARFAESALALVNEGAGVLLTDPFSTGGALGSNVVLKKLAGAPKFSLNLYWNPDRPRSRHVETVSRAFKDALSTRLADPP